MKNNKSKTLTWEDFQALGNPQNVEFPEDVEGEIKHIETHYSSFRVRIFLDKKRRGGKKVTIIRGVGLNDEVLKDLCKEMKSLCGVGGSSKNGELLMQGDQRTRLLHFLVKKGFTDTKVAGG